MFQWLRLHAFNVVVPVSIPARDLCSTYYNMPQLKIPVTKTWHSQINRKIDIKNKKERENIVTDCKLAMHDSIQLGLDSLRF